MKTDLQCGRGALTPRGVTNRNQVEGCPQIIRMNANLSELRLSLLSSVRVNSRYSRANEWLRVDEGCNSRGEGTPPTPGRFYEETCI
jgi:hypothetical protein